jgi:hypothetical protein
MKLIDDGKRSERYQLENDHFRVSVRGKNGAIESVFVKKNNCELVEEKRLAANFRLCLPLEDYLCNYIDGAEQEVESITQEDNAITVTYSGMKSEKGTFPVDLSYTVVLADDTIRFRAKLTNHSENPVSEFWFPRIGGWKRFGHDREADLTVPYYNRVYPALKMFKQFPGSRILGAEAGEWTKDYGELGDGCGVVMPWFHYYDKANDTGLYLGYHDKMFRFSTWHHFLWPTVSGRLDSWIPPDQAAGEPVGLVFSHVRYPFVQSGESFESGEFVIHAHKGDWHIGGLFYRKWFMEHFPFDKSKSWLRKQSCWFTSIIHQPEDRIIADYKKYEQWSKDAEEIGINTFEITGWHKGGLERNYPEYVPEDMLGGREGFRKLLKSIRDRNGHSLVFVNYNVLDSNCEYYEKVKQFTHQDLFGHTSNCMGYGESTLMARKSISVRRHVVSSIVPEIEEILAGHYTDIVKDGAMALQIDKLCIGSLPDFNPLTGNKPDVALCEHLVRSVGRVLEKCKEIDPAFCIAAEAIQDRLIPYVDVFYRNAEKFDIAALRYVFPEWTACQHISAPYDYHGVNGAILTGSVICFEPDNYQSSVAKPLYKKIGLYIQEVERIRKKLFSIIFLGKYHDVLGAAVQVVEEEGADKKKGPAETVAHGFAMFGGPVDSSAGTTEELHYRVHEDVENGPRAITVANPSSDQSYKYYWKFTDKPVSKAKLYEPFEQIRTVSKDEPLEIKREGLHILVEVPE